MKILDYCVQDQCHSKLSVNVCPDNIFLNPQSIVTKFGMVIHYQKPESCAKKNWVAIFQVKATGLKKKKKSNNNNFCSLQPPTWNGMLPECFSCLTITERENECGEWEWWGRGEEGERESMCVCVRVRGREGQRERKKGRRVGVRGCFYQSNLVHCFIIMYLF